MVNRENHDDELGSSHQLIDQNAYLSVYSALKEKYGQKLEDGWEESTDPKKFIYEDIAIASYLIVLWKSERQEGEKLQKFVDLGCGNGLLVYILSQEGHDGYGIDLRRRRIWDKFPPETDLREHAICPSDHQLFPDVDWIIGNHSDELSPWIPVISSRSSFRTKYFLLPCCAFEFSGEKYQKKGGTKSQYLSYIDYLLKISEVCGFENTRLDRLKIPSTKRICLVGRVRSYDRENFNVQCETVQNFIDDQSHHKRGSSDKWSESFTPREKVEAVRNCTTIERTLSETIVKRIFNHILNMQQSFDTLFPDWNLGGELPLAEAVKLVSKDELKVLKNECGGLQTLLRNKHQVFKIYGGRILIRKPKRVSDINERSLKKNVIKSSPCYFFNNHPNHCPLTNEECCYAHGDK